MSTYLKRESFYVLKVFIDGLLFAASYMALYYIKRRNLYFEGDYWHLFLVMMGLWFLATVFSRKFKRVAEDDYFRQTRPFLVSIVALTAMVSLAVYLLGWYHLSRFVVYGTIALFLVLENLYLTARNVRLWRIGAIETIPFSVVFFLLELLAIAATFTAVYLFRKGTVKMPEDYLVLLMGIFFIWFVSSLLIHKFDVRMDDKFLNVVFPFWKSEVIIVGLTAYFIVVLNLAAFSRFIILGSLLVFALFENLIVTLYFLHNRPRLADDDPIAYLRATPAEFEPQTVAAPSPGTQRQGRYRIPGTDHRSRALVRQLRTVYLNRFAEVYDFIDARLHLSRLAPADAAVLFSRNPYNIEILRDGSLRLFVNLRRVNDFRRINQNLIATNRKLKRGGVYVGRFEGKRQLKDRLRDTYPPLVARSLILLNFLVHRLWPRLPLVRRLYFFITKGRGRALSKAEALGRLVFCGFEILALETIGHQTWFMVRKAREPNGDRNPSYGPFFKQRRLGKNGKIIHMLKVRTMHPYSEYLHAWMLANHPLDASGKIKDDFRMTGWGRLFRRLYIDELPMFLNWLRRDVKLVGVRPLSESFFATYPKDLQRLRSRTKPGLIPPYYADMPGSIEEVWTSERAYLEQYFKRPRRTDLVYFFRALNNILFHHAKSS